VSHPTRREWLAGAAALGTTIAAAPLASAQPADRPAGEPFGYCLNTSTISGQKLDIVEVVEVAAKAGYQGLEPWIRELDAHQKNGGSLRDLGKRIRDRGLTVESAIAFPDWMTDDEERRKKGVEEAKRCMDLVQQIGGARLAAPPANARAEVIDLRKVAERYRTLLEIGDQIGVVPLVELWGFAKTLGRLSEVMFVALECGHPKASVLLDVYHLYKGGSSFDGLRLISGTGFQVIHFNDYPAEPPRASITDAMRIYPGDGVAPMKQIMQSLRAIGFRGMLSLELFSQEYWKQDALAVARTGIEKMRAVVRSNV
jgi:sugar phosphate isomerase/epimerase